MHEEGDHTRYKDGSIYRIKLKNILTYSECEFNPGPRLNVVLGPNGTGKSSIVCAICIGLNGSPKLLGRAEKIGQFVRHERDSGFIEIELYFKKGNVTIRREIYLDNKSIWFLNGEKVTQHIIQEQIKAAHIQIDNLNQFLPQDKVNSFSKMNPQQLLQATLEAAPSQWQLAETHLEMIESQKESGDHVNLIDSVRKNIEELEAANLSNERVVERFRERQRKQEELEHLNKKKRYLEIQELKEQIQRMRVEKKNMQTVLQELCDDVKPLEEECQKLRLEQVQCQQEIEFMEKSTKKTKLNLEKIKSNLLGCEESEIGTQSRLNSIRSEQMEKKKNLERLQIQVEKLELELESNPSSDELKLSRSALTSQISSLHRQAVELKGTQQEEMSKLEDLNRDVTKLDRSLQLLTNERNRVKEAIFKKDNSILRALDLIEREKHVFQRKIWGPVALELNLALPLYATFVENIVSHNVLFAFVTECMHDYDHLVRLCNEGNHVRQQDKISVYNVEQGKAKPFESPCDARNDPFQALGIQGFLDQIIVAPEVIMEVLRSNSGIHQVLMGSELTESKINQGENVLEQLGMSNSRLITPSKRYITSTSKYGNRNTVTRVNDLHEAKFLVASDSNEDQNEKMQLENQLIEKQQTIQKIKDNLNLVKSQLSQLATERMELERGNEEIRQQLKHSTKLENQLQDCHISIQRYKNELKQDISKMEESLARKIQLEIKQHIQHLDTYQKETGVLISRSIRQSQKKLHATSCKSQFTTKENFLQKFLQEITHKKNALDGIKRKLTQEREKFERWKQTHNQVLTPQLEIILRALPDDFQQLDSQIQQIQIFLENVHQDDHRVVRLYEETKKKIDEEKKHLNQLETDMAEKDSVLATKRETWIGQLKELIARIDNSFKDYFQEIGCEGEVVLNDESASFSKWGIERRVKFRENTELVTVTAEEQSGGEKSVATILYLMALQVITDCPFRVVDEINQGMDAVNERKIFKQITRSSCGSFLPQYFLITPKLITNLEYNEDVKILFIFNGPYNIKQQDWDWKRICQGANPRKRRRNTKSSH